MTELRKIAALAAAYDIPVIPHGGGTSQDGLHFIMATPNSPWAEMFMPAPGGPPEVYRRFEEDYQITRGPEGIYTRRRTGRVSAGISRWRSRGEVRRECQKVCTNWPPMNADSRG